jgi:TonB family protein
MDMQVDATPVKTFLLTLAVMLTIPATALFAQETLNDIPDSTRIFPDPDEFMFVEKEPGFSMEELYSHLEYPEEAILNGAETKVTIHVFINKKGRPTRAQAEKDDDPVLAAAAIRAIQQTTFSPAIQNAEPVGVWMRIPVTFKPD